MYKNLVANSPFIDIEFIESAKNLKNSDSENVFDYYKLKSNILSFSVERDFIDYRITPYFSKDQIDELKIEEFNLDSLSYFQIKEFLNRHSFSSVEIRKSDITVYIQLPDSYDSYLNNLSKKNRHEFSI